MPCFEYRLAPIDVYLQEPASFLLISRHVVTSFAPGFKVLSRTSTGLSMRLEIGNSAAHPSALQGPQRRRCDGLAWLGLHPLHPRFAPLRRACEQGGPACDRASYVGLDERLGSLCEGDSAPADAAKLIDDLVTHAARRAGTDQAALDARVRRVMQQYEAGRTNIHELAREVGLSTSRLSHLFSQEAGMTFRHYALWTRTARAWRQVAFAPDRSLTDIAHDLQFADAAHMSHSFSSVFGYSPRALREPGRWRIHGAPATP